MSDIGKTADDLFEDQESADEFLEFLQSTGLVVSTLDDGLVMGLTLSKLQELVALASADEDERVVIFIKRAVNDVSDEILN